MITVEQLTDNLEFLKERHHQIDKINEALEDFNPDFPTYFPSDDIMETKLVESMERELGDICHWLSYYIYDCDFGQREDIAVWDEDDKPIPLKSIQDLLNLIESDKDGTNS